MIREREREGLKVNFEVGGSFIIGEGGSFSAH